MKRILGIIAFLLVVALLTSCRTTEPSTDTEAATMIETDPPVSETVYTPPINEPEGEISMESIEYYQNPILTAQSEQAWPGYGFGDPFVMRYNGVYYLYVSTKDGSVGIKCWSSLDLVNWQYEGFCSNDPITRGAYAPEVYYYNGYFYMYTSPAGNGHYVLRSTSPVKGFEPITGNLGMSIDGSVFIDNDGKWYFYTANHGEMMAYKMTSPSEMSGGRTLNGVTVNNAWTEGPMVVYHDGYYYLTYTGNHVLSKSYRIYYGASKRSPISYTSITADNPLLINTSDEIFGIGHSSTVKGPDLDSYYIVYHSLVNLTPNRNMNIDRIVFNGESMEIMGPTVDKQQVPDLPDVYHYFEPGASLKGWSLKGAFGSGRTGLSLSADSLLVSKTPFEGDFTAEYNITSISEGGQAGAIFAYTDSENFGACYFSPEEQKVIIEITVSGKTTVTKADTVRSFRENTRFDCLQSLQIERNGNDYTFYMNDRLLCVIPDSALTGGSIGYMTKGGEASFGFIGGTGAVGGRGVADTYKSLSELNGLIPAISYTSGDFERSQRDGVTLVTAKEGDILNYRVLASSDGGYDLAVRYHMGTSGKDTTLEVYVDGTPVTTVPLTASLYITTAICRDIPMTEGQHIVSFKLTAGQADFLDFTLLKNQPVTPLTLDFVTDADGHIYSDGNWSLKDGRLTLTEPHASGKRLYGNKNWGDYTVEVTVTPLGTPNSGLLVRATNPGAPNFMNHTPTNDDAAAGTDWVEGYFVGLTSNAVILGKQSYSYKELTHAEGRFEAGKTYQLKVVCRGARLQVYVDGELYLDYIDADPFMQGMVGIRSCGCAVGFDDLKVTED